MIIYPAIMWLALFGSQLAQPKNRNDLLSWFLMVSEKLGD